MQHGCWSGLVLVLSVSPTFCNGATPRENIAVLRQVGANGLGSSKAAQAWKELAALPATEIPTLLAAMDKASPLTRNWLRAAIDAIIEGETSAKLPLADLQAFVKDTQHASAPRFFAYQLWSRVDPDVAKQYLAELLDDPSPALRFLAVKQLLTEAEAQAKAKEEAAAKQTYRRAFAAARDQYQIVSAARQLESMGEKINLTKHLGLVIDWQVIGPFPNEKSTGIDTVYPPEQQFEPNASYPGKNGPVQWQAFSSKDKLAIVDFNAAIGQDTEVVGYALAEFFIDEAREVEIRLGSFNVFKLWVNGELVLARSDAYTGMRLDHYSTPAKLKKGKNTILIKLAQDVPPPQLPQKLWQFMLRVCDPQGVAVHSQAPATP